MGTSVYYYRLRTAMVRFYRRGSHRCVRSPQLRYSFAPVIGALIGVIMGFVIVSCSIPSDQQASPNNLPTTTPTIDSKNIKAACDFFYNRTHEALLTTEGQGNADLLASRDGVPTELERAVKAYYANNVRPTNNDSKALLNERYAAVIRTCQKFGWKN